MQFIPIEQLVIPENRQRTSFDERHLTELADSISTIGLLHPPVVRDDGKTLIAGECRIRAMSILHSKGIVFRVGTEVVPKDTFPVSLAGTLSPDALEEAELDENIKRRDLTWRERSEAIARLHALRTKQAVAVGEVQTMRATATEIKGSPAVGGEITEIREAQLLTTFKDDPEVSKAKSRPEALSIVRKKMLAEFQEKLAQDFHTDTAGSVPHELLMGSCIDFLPALTPEVFDVIITDPPYGIDAHKMAPLSGSEAGTKHEYDDTYESAKQVWCAILFDGYKACAKNAALYMFCDFQYYNELSNLANIAGWTVWDRPIIWHKPGGGMLGDIQHGPRRSYETILFAYKGDKRTLGTFNDVITMNNPSSLLHAAEKPVDLYVELLRRSCVPGMHVLDPCGGSGPLFPAANRLNLVATIIERSTTHAQTALSRIADKV